MNDDTLYRETLRPQFHFTAKQHWINDPNGLVYFDGEYHLYFQHTPGGERLFPGKRCIQCIAHSNDRGRTWMKYAGNPVIGHIRSENRDPKVVWYEPTARWIMTLFMDGNDYVLFSSPDLKSWTRLQDLTLPGVSECPDFFELPVDGDPSNTRWVFWGASGGYLLGRFDGMTYVPESAVLQAEVGANGYAAQTWSDLPSEDGRRIQISWMRDGKYPAMPFNQQMTFPVELTLRTLPEGIRLCREPVREIELLHTGTRNWPGGDLAAMAAEQFRRRYGRGEIGSYAVTSLHESERRLVLAEEGDLFDVRIEIEVDEGKGFEIEVQGHRVEYDADRQALSCFGRSADLRSVNGRVFLQLLVDRTSVEIFGNHGERSMSFCFLPAAADQSLALRADGGGVRIVSLTVHELRSAWDAG